MPPHGPMKAPAKPKNAKGTLKRLIGMLKDHRLKLLLVALCIVVTSGVSAFGVYLLQPVYTIIGELAAEYAKTQVMPALTGLLKLLLSMALPPFFVSIA